MTAFARVLFWTTLALAAGAAALAAILPGYRLPAALAGLALMAANALAAVGALYLRLRLEPVKLIMLSMAVRLPLIATVMISAIVFLRPEPPAAYSFLFTALAAYLAFQIAEIRHVLRHPEMLRR